MAESLGSSRIGRAGRRRHRRSIGSTCRRRSGGRGAEGVAQLVQERRAGGLRSDRCSAGAAAAAGASRSRSQQPQPQPQPPAPRSTPVGHASGDLAAPRRSPAPDPRRMTMFGHVSHFGIESPPAPAPGPATAPAPTASPAPAAHRGAADANARVAPPRHQPSANAHAPAWETPTQPDPLRLADYLRRQAAQPPAVASWPAADEPDARGRWTIPIVVAAVGIAALASVVIAIKTGEKPGPGMTSVPPSAPPVALPVRPGAALERAPAPLKAPAEDTSKRTGSERRAPDPTPRPACRGARSAELTLSSRRVDTATAFEQLTEAATCFVRSRARAA